MAYNVTYTDMLMLAKHYRDEKEAWEGLLKKYGPEEFPHAASNVRIAREDEYRIKDQLSSMK